MVNRIIYLGYYIKNLDKNQYSAFLKHASSNTGKSSFSLIVDSIFSSIRFNISLLEYFQFRFFENKDIDYRNSWAGTGHMYEYQLKKNPKIERSVLDNKAEFAQTYRKFILHKVLSKYDNSFKDDLIKLIHDQDELVLKDAYGKCGKSIQFISTDKYTVETLIEYMDNEGLNLVEVVLTQHSDLSKLSPSGINSIRIITNLDDNGEVTILAARLRITVENKVDNLAAGNLAAEIDSRNGIVVGPGVYSDITKKELTNHPVTGEKILGFVIPYWDDILLMCRNAALTNQLNKSIGWDVVVTPKGPGLIEGNHDWCKLLWQLPAKKGLKALLPV